MNVRAPAGAAAAQRLSAGALTPPDRRSAPAGAPLRSPVAKSTRSPGSHCQTRNTAPSLPTAAHGSHTGRPPATEADSGLLPKQRPLLLRGTSRRAYANSASTDAQRQTTGEGGVPFADPT